MNGSNYEETSMTMESAMDDLQLAAHLGKVLLQRNDSLEQQLEQQLAINEDKELQISILQKQLTAYRELDESRFSIYHKLEINIEELETSNSRLLVERNITKETINCLKRDNESLEFQVDDMNKQLIEMMARFEALKRESANLAQLKVPNDVDDPVESASIEGGATKKKCRLQKSSAEEDAHKELLSLTLNKLNSQRVLCQNAQDRADDLEKQLAILIRENHSLTKRNVQHVAICNDFGTMHDELSELFAAGRPEWISRFGAGLEEWSFTDEVADDDDDSAFSSPTESITRIRERNLASTGDSAVKSTESNETHSIDSNSSDTMLTATEEDTIDTSYTESAETTVDDILRMLPNKRDQQSDCPSSSAQTRKKNRRKSRFMADSGLDETLLLPTPPRVFFSSGGRGGRRDMRSVTLGNAVAALENRAVTEQSFWKRSAASKSLRQLIQLDLSHSAILCQQLKTKGAYGQC